jgi:uncharacterized HAD superfamily protein
MKIGFDIDEVLYRTIDELLIYLKEEFGVTRSLNAFKNYSFYENNFHSNAEKSYEIADKLHEYVHIETPYLNGKPYEEGVKAIQRLKRAGHSIHLITAREKAFKKITVKWLRKYKVHYDTLHVIGKTREEEKAEEKTKAYGRYVDKGALGRLLNLDCYIDDFEGNLESMIQYKKRWRKGLILLDRPWNHDYIDGSKFKRMYTWEEILRHLGVHKR